MPGGVAGRAAVLGSPIGHSLSPTLHRAAYSALGRDWSYTAIECDEAGLPALFARVRTEPGWVGLSLTMPLKIAALGLLDEVDELAGLIGAVNTVVVRGGTAGTRLVGYNTDVDGIAYAVDQVFGAGAGAGAGPAVDGARPTRPVVLGAGGTARAAIAALARRKVPTVDLFARRPAAAEPLVELGAALGTTVTAHPWADLDGPGGLDGLGGLDGPGGRCDLVLATTPAGATDALAGLPWPPGRALVELLYHPWPTRLAAAARAAGAPVVGGLTVLAAQAVGQVRLFTAGGEVGVDVLRAAGEATLADRL